MLEMSPQTARPGWQDVEELIERLCAKTVVFASATSARNAITQYEPGRRLLLETDVGPRWVAVTDIQACWETFERLDRIGRSDVLEPGRCSAFMIALFAQVEGVVDEAGDVERLSLPAR
jgi:hypothetical protein